MESIIQSERECWFCGAITNLECHHMIHGTSNRKNAEKYGLKLYLCQRHHAEVHNDKKLDLVLITMAQKKFEETHTRDEFRSIFGKSWL